MTLTLSPFLSTVKLIACKLFIFLFTCKGWWMEVHFSNNPTGMLQNGGSSGAAALQQEMNSDIRAMDLGGPTASWEIMALTRETTRVTSRKRSSFTVLQNKAQIYLNIIHLSFLLRGTFLRWFITDNIFSKHKSHLHNTKSQSNKVRRSLAPSKVAQISASLLNFRQMGSNYSKEWLCSCASNSFGVPLPSVRYICL